MRIPLIAGNWKMFKDVNEAKEFCVRFRELYKDTDIRALLLVPFTSIETVKRNTEGTNISVGAQNVYFEREGAYTGEISAPMLKALGVEYCIVGHSERRGYFGETDETVNLKAKALLEEGILPVICVGESLEIREADGQNEHVRNQIRADFSGISAEDAMKCVVAYEPIWAIGTGRTATPKQAGEMCSLIREELISMYGEDAADEIIIQYGGSVKPENITDIMNMPEIDGALVGGASLDPVKFMDIINF
ncbi:MAG: triose-phosphate isomerase [Clostridia bacterium]|nr:triose-phosphate isomerase [Clostridia bacterium]